MDGCIWKPNGSGRGLRRTPPGANAFRRGGFQAWAELGGGWLTRRWWQSSSFRSKFPWCPEAKVLLASDAAILLLAQRQQLPICPNYILRPSPMQVKTEVQVQTSPQRCKPAPPTQPAEPHLAGTHSHRRGSRRPFPNAFGFQIHPSMHG